MNFVNKYFYFGKVEDEFVENFGMDYPDGWEEGYFFRIRIDEDNLEIKVEDSCGRMVPLSFNDIHSFISTLKNVEKEIVEVVTGIPKKKLWIEE